MTRHLIAALAQSSALRGSCDSSWAANKWQPVPQYYPHEIKTDLFGRQVTPALPPFRLTSRSVGASA